MDEELQNSNRPSVTSLEQALDTWPSWSSEPPEVVKQLKGLSNQSYLVRTFDADYVVRINNTNTNLGVDRLREQKILGLIAKQSYAPTIDYWHADFLVSRFIPSLPAKTQIKSLTEIASIFAAIHKFKATDQTAEHKELINTLNPLQHLQRYFEFINQPSTALSTCYEIIRAQPYPQLQTSACLCHHDLLDENILSTSNGFKIIDWEYAQFGNPLFDIAVYAETKNLNGEQTQILLGAYNSQYTVAQLAPYRLLYAGIEILWWLQRQPDVDLAGEIMGLLKRCR